MTDHTPDTGQRTPGDVPIEEGRKSFWDTSMLVWAIPLIALVVALGAVWRTYNDQGPLIEVAFDEAAGIRADETQLRYRDITVGLVEGVRFDDDLTQVVVDIRLDKALAPYVDSDAKFWVVSPQVTAQGVSGLDTVLSGVYIRGSWDNVPGTAQSMFEGLDTAPLLSTGTEGKSFTLKSAEGLPGAGTPILYKNVQVGVIGESAVNSDGTGVTAEAVIYDPHTEYVTSSTRFWDISGFSFSLGASGAKLNFTSLASLISGGITFETIGSGGEALADGMEFDLFPDEDAARDDFLVSGEGATVDMIMVFEENLAGLSTGAAVELGGLRVGEVTSINGIVDRDRFGDSEVRLITSVKLNPSRIGLGDDAGEAELFDYLDTRIAEGLRARLTNASIFTGGLKIELAEVPGAADASLDRTAEPLPAMPTAASNVTDVGATAQGALQRVSDLPIEEVMQSVVDFLDNASSLIGSEDLQRAPQELTGLLAAAREVAESEGVQGLPGQLGDIFESLLETAQTIDNVTSDLEDQDIVGRLTGVIDGAGSTLDTLPGLVEDVRALIASAEEVPLAELSASLEELLTSAESLMSEADALLAGEDLQAVPADVRGILASVREITESEGVRALPDQLGGLLDSLLETAQTLDDVTTELQTQETVAKLTGVIENAGSTVDSLPALVDDMRALLANAEEVPLAELSASLEELLTSAESLLSEADALLAGEDLQAVPGEIRGILASVREVTESEGVQGLPARTDALLAGLQDTAATLDRLMTEVETQDTVAKITAAVDDVAVAADGLPQLVEQARGILDQAGEARIDELADAATDLLNAAGDVLDQDSTRQIPAELNASLASLRGTLQELQDGGLISNANATLASASQAADAIANASASLPELARDLRRVASQAGTTLADFSEDSRFSRETRGAIDSIQSAAQAIERLARTIERNPNSLLLGR
ncbi:MlaD family protein [Thalassococcus sp. BH17M4-6]|uniref:MlaD family protein n=1 Tax=Thalassococcus sp. BH17M4-6 TaxID=3413148 RepID=UPI003BC736ED